MASSWALGPKGCVRSSGGEEPQPASSGQQRPHGRQQRALDQTRSQPVLGAVFTSSSLRATKKVARRLSTEAQDVGSPRRFCPMKGTTSLGGGGFLRLEQRAEPRLRRGLLRHHRPGDGKLRLLGTGFSSAPPSPQPCCRNLRSCCEVVPGRRRGFLGGLRGRWLGFGLFRLAVGKRPNRPCLSMRATTGRKQDDHQRSVIHAFAVLTMTYPPHEKPGRDERPPRPVAWRDRR